MKNYLHIVAYILVGILLCTNLYQCHKGSSGSPEGTYTDTVTLFKTVPVYKPVLRDSVVIRYVVQTLPVVPKLPEIVPEIRDSVPKSGEIVPKESQSVSDTEIRDSASVEIPITQKVYSEENYTAYVSGYQPSLDSLIINSPVQTVRIKDKPKRWGIGVQVGYGVTIGSTPKFAPYVGVGISYNILNF